MFLSHFSWTSLELLCFGGGEANFIGLEKKCPTELWNEKASQINCMTALWIIAFHECFWNIIIWFEELHYSQILRKIADVETCLSVSLRNTCNTWWYVMFLQHVTVKPFYFQSGGCPDGYYCPLGTGHPLSFPCESGFFRNESHGHGGGACVKCPARYYCASVATHTPLVCPEVKH